MQIFQEIRKDHEKQKLLMEILVQTKGNSDSRRENFEQFKTMLKIHESAERKHFYAPLLDRKKTQKLTQNASYSHLEIDEMVADLNTTDMSSPAWLPKMKQLRELVLDHIAAEHALLFDRADEVLTETEALNLAEDYLDEKSIQNSNFGKEDVQ